MKRLALAATLGALLCAAAHAAGELPPARFADPQRRQKLAQALPGIAAHMAQQLQGLRAPGLAYAVIVDNELVLVRGVGLRDVAGAAPVQEDTVFRIASMTKSFTALAVLKLRDEGRLNLDDPVSRHLPELRQWPLPTTDAAPLTLRHLLAHTGGLPEDNPQGDRQLAITPQAFSAWLQGGVPFATATGSAFEYSNLGYMVLGRVVTNVAGRPVQDYIRDEILRPLGMRSTFWSAAAVPAERLAKGHRRQGEGWADEALLPDGEGAAMGGLMTTPADLARWVQLMLGAWPPRDAPEAAPALRRTLREMQAGLSTPWLDVEPGQGGRPLTITAASYGFGLMSEQDCTFGRMVEHSGGLPGFGSDMRWLPDHGVGVVVLANGTYAGAGRLTREVLHLLKATGGLQPRQAQASPALQQAAREVAALVLDWSDERAHSLVADNLLLDRPLAERRAAIATARQGLGTCTPGALKAENALRGEVQLDCQNGALLAQFSLAPTQPLKVQWLRVRPLRPPAAGAADEPACVR